MGSRSQHSAPKTYGSPISTPKPGGTGRKRPKVGDKDPDYKPRKASPPAAKKEKKPELNYNHRDWRGTRGAIDDAEGVKRKK
jgi:hypothetical protein